MDFRLLAQALIRQVHLHRSRVVNGFGGYWRSEQRLRLDQPGKGCKARDDEDLGDDLEILNMEARAASVETAKEIGRKDNEENGAQPDARAATVTPTAMPVVPATAT